MMVFPWMFQLIECEECGGNEFEAVEVRSRKGQDILDGKLKCKGCGLVVEIKEGVPLLGIKSTKKDGV